MINNLKEINKKISQWKRLGNEIITLVKNNIIVGEINFPATQKTRKPRKSRESTIDPAPSINEKPRKVRKQRTPKEKALPDADKNNSFYNGKSGNE